MLYSPVCIVFLSLLYGTAVSGSVIDNIHYVGCYDPGFSLSKNYHHHISSISLVKCVTYCLQAQTRYAGIEHSDNFCYCGSDIAEESTPRENDMCATECPEGEAPRTCGGDWLMSLYEISPQQPLPGSDTHNNVSFLIGLSNGIRLYNFSTIDTFDTIMSTTEWVYAVDYHFAKNVVFAIAKGKLYTTTMDNKPTGPSSSPTLVKRVSSCDGFAVDWVRDKLYWADCSDNRIISMDLDGGNETVLLQRTEVRAVIKRMEVDPYKGMLFWIADSVVESCQLSGGNFQTNVSEEGVSVRALALDLPSRRLYYVGSMNQTTSLFSVDYSGGASRVHASMPQMKSVYGLSLLRGQLYWVNYANVRDVIYSAALRTAPRVTNIKSIERAVWHMRVVHPDLQKAPRIDPCEDKGCSHTCVKLTSTSARCECPEGGDLKEDGVTCSDRMAVQLVAQSVSPVGAITLGILLVVTVVLVSVLFLYLGDRYWSHLQAKFLVVPYSRSRGTDQDGATSVYDAADDNVNLI